MTKAFKDLMVRQLDEVLAPWRPLKDEGPPDGGWVRTIREALGMSQRQLAERMGVSKTTVNSAERNEARGTIRMDSLVALASGLECDLVYALVPRESLSATLSARAGRKQSGHALGGRGSSRLPFADVRDSANSRFFPRLFVCWA